MAKPEVLEPVPANADGPTTLVAMGHAVLRIENETLAQVAIQRPRDEAKVLGGALKELELVPEEASRAYYEIPYRDTAPGGEQKMVKVTGPSIKAATALARRWGNCSATARILGEDADSIELEGVFIDFETSVRFTRPHRVSKYMKTRRGIVTLDPKRLEAAVGAGASKAMRNAILTGLPAYLVAAYDRRAREIAGGKAEAPLDTKTRGAIVKAFSEFKVEEKHLAAYLEKPAAEWTGADRASLIGVYNAIKDGQTTAAEVFFGETETTAAPTDSVTLTPESLATAAVTGKDDADADRQRADLIGAILPLWEQVTPVDQAALLREHLSADSFEATNAADPAALTDLKAALVARVNAAAGGKARK